MKGSPQKTGSVEAVSRVCRSVVSEWSTSFCLASSSPCSATGSVTVSSHSVESGRETDVGELTQVVGALKYFGGGAGEKGGECVVLRRASSSSETSCDGIFFFFFFASGFLGCVSVSV